MYRYQHFGVLTSILHIFTKIKDQKPFSEKTTFPIKKNKDDVSTLFVKYHSFCLQVLPSTPFLPSCLRTHLNSHSSVYFLVVKPVGYL